MKFKFLLIPAILILGCSSQNDISGLMTLEDYSYSQVEDKTIEWVNIFNVPKEEYLVYIYSASCGHCQQIKNVVIPYGMEHDNFYFVSFMKGIPIIADPESIIGKSNIEEIGIVGTPSLFKISSGVLTENIVGANAIVETLTNKS